MKDAFRKDDWARRLRPFNSVWDRVQGEHQHRPPPPPPPFVPGPPMPPPPPPFVPGPPMPPPPPPFVPGPPMPPPPPPFVPGPPKKPCKNCCTKAVRFNPKYR